MRDTSRRAVLRGAGAVGCCALGGALAASALDRRDGGEGEADGGDERTDDPTATPSPPAGDRSRDDHLWVAPGLWRDERLRENVVAFAARHDLVAVFSQADVSDGARVDEVLDAVAAADEAGVTPWLATAVPTSLTPREFVTDPAARERHLDALRSAARRYADVAPEGSVVIWEEAPVAGQWIPGGAWNDRAADALVEYGPELFVGQRAAVAEAAPDVDAGIFLHFPYVVESRQPEVFSNLMDDLERRGSLPDFVFTDFYRGWYEKDVGPVPANNAVRSLVDNAARHSRDRPVYFLGQTHTIDPRHTPSTQAMRMDLRAALEAGADGVGWYARTAYKQTRHGFDPFVPNEPGEESMPSTGRVNTLTVARDRFAYAYRATFAARDGVDPRTRFDLWVHAEAPGFYGHRVSARTGDGWTPLGDIAAAHPTVAPVEESAHVSVFHALDATRLLDGGELELRIETRDGRSGRLRGVHLLPFVDGVAFTERDATRLLGERSAASADPVASAALGGVERDDTLESGATLDVAVPVEADADGAAVSTDERRAAALDLLAPGTREHRERLAAAEREAGFDRDRRFDCWVRASGVEDPETAVDRLDLPGDAPVTAAVGDGAGVFCGLRRRALGDDPDATLADVVGRAGDLRVDAAYAMPYFGSRDVRLPDKVGRLLRDSPDEVETFSFARAER